MTEINPLPEELTKIIGLQLSIAGLAADMRNFGFGKIREVPRGILGEYALHVQCPWRIEHDNHIITGSSDLWEPAEDSPDIDWETWHYRKNPNYQDKILLNLFQGYDKRARFIVNKTDKLFVEEISLSPLGDLRIILSGGYVLALFPSSALREHWRLFSLEPDSPHLVFEGDGIRY